MNQIKDLGIKEIRNSYLCKESMDAKYCTNFSLFFHILFYQQLFKAIINLFTNRKMKLREVHLYSVHSTGNTGI